MRRTTDTGLRAYRADMSGNVIGGGGGGGDVRGVNLRDHDRGLCGQADGTERIDLVAGATMTSQLSLLRSRRRKMGQRKDEVLVREIDQYCVPLCNTHTQTTG